MLFVSFITITILTGWWFAYIEFPVGFSGLSATEIVRNRYLGLIILSSVIVGGCFFSASFVENISKGAGLTSSGSSIIIAVAASLAVLLNYKLSRYSSISYAIMGAVLGWNIFNKTGIDFSLPFKYVLIWFLAPFFTALIASLIYRFYRFFIQKKKLHLFVLIPYLRILLLLIAVVFAILIGINNGALLITLIQTVSSGFNFSWNGIHIGEEYVLFIFSIILLGLLSWNKTSEKINEMSEGKFDVSIEFILIIMIAGTIVLGIFSIPALSTFLALPLTPLSIAGIILGGFAGINFVRKNQHTKHTEEFRMLLSTITTPLASCILSCFILSIIDTESFLPKDIEKINNSREIVNITPVITAIAILVVSFFILIYLRKQQRGKTQAEIILLENQNKLFENQKAMATLEVKTVVTENENLNTKLELRRKELINIALSITEQKKFQEKIFNEIKSLKETDNLEELKKGIEKIEKQLLQKMNYSQELKSFYAQIETMHKDFNLRLTEKFPKLTEQERRLTTLLRLGFSSKHIASLMNISPKSVEMSRYRLRNRLGLKHNQNLIDYIKNI